MAKFPILEWKEIDGVNTPFAYPQHKKKDGSFVVTGENDPLPVAGYGMTDNGIWIPKRVNDDGSVNTQLTGSYVGDGESLPTRSQKSDITTILDSVTVNPGDNTGRIPIPLDGAKKAILLLNSSQPYRARGTELWGNPLQDRHAYPDMSDTQIATVSTNYPHTQVLGYKVGDWAESEEEALWKSMLFNTMHVMMFNEGDEPATVSVRVMRVWGVEI